MSLLQSIKTVWRIARAAMQGAWFLVRHRQMVDDMKDAARDRFEEAQAFYDEAEACPDCEVEEGEFRPTIVCVCDRHREQYVRIDSGEHLDSVFREHGIDLGSSDDGGVQQ